MQAFIALAGAYQLALIGAIIVPKSIRIEVAPEGRNIWDLVLC